MSTLSTDMRDFTPTVGQSFDFRADWGSIECRVLTIEPPHILSYSWNALGVDSAVTWTLDPSDAGARVHMEQAGFSVQQEQAFQGARFGGQMLLGKLDQSLARAD